MQIKIAYTVVTLPCHEAQYNCPFAADICMWSLYSSISLCWFGIYHVNQILTKLRFSRNDLTATEKEKFKVILHQHTLSEFWFYPFCLNFTCFDSILLFNHMFLQQLLESDDFYRIRLPSNVLHPSGKEYVISSVKAVSLKPLTRHYTSFFFVI